MARIIIASKYKNSYSVDLKDLNIRCSMDQARVTSAELRKNLGQTINRARFEPIMVTQHDRNHVVILAAEEYSLLLQAARKARLTTSLTNKEIDHAALAVVPTLSEQEDYLAQLESALQTEKRP